MPKGKGKGKGKKSAEPAVPEKRIPDPLSEELTARSVPLHPHPPPFSHLAIPGVLPLDHIIPYRNHHIYVRVCASSLPRIALKIPRTLPFPRTNDLPRDPPPLLPG